ncbi:hemagglutinin repeat-containing protein, partial [Gallibacterium anatis]|uniref:hemagglutinin repeat-containing protein n=7 Tax=Gallibacterium anatis TaxID=750 RepID=UPI001B339EF3
QQGDLSVTSHQAGITQQGSFIAKGKAQGKGNITLKAKETINQSGESLAEGDIRYRAKDIETQATSRVASGVIFKSETDSEPKVLAPLSAQGSQMMLSATDKATLSGQYLAQGKLQIQSNAVTLDGSILNAYDTEVTSYQQALQANHITSYTENFAQWYTPHLFSTQQSHIQAKQHNVKAYQWDNSKGIWQYRGESPWQLWLTGGLNNSEGVIESVAALSLQAERITNAKGTFLIKKSGLFHLGQGGVNNTQGQFQVQQRFTLYTENGDINNADGLLNGLSDVTITTRQGKIDNTRGILSVHGDSVITTNGGEIDNQQGLLQAKQTLKIDSGRINNTQGLIQSGGAAILNTHSAAFINQNTLRPQYDQGLISLADLTLITPHVQNTQGYIAAKNSAQLNIAQMLDNSQAEITGQQALTIQGVNLMLNNRQGHLNSARELAIDAFQLSGDGDIQSGGNLTVALQSDFIADTDIQAKQHLHFTTTGTVTNKAKWLAGNTLTLVASELNNTLNGVLSANTTQLMLQHQLTNRGLINSFSPENNSLTLIKAAHIENSGTGRIYGDHLALQANTLLNQDERTEDIHSAIIAARQRLDIGVANVTNRTAIYEENKKGGTSIYSEGDIYLGRTLDDNYHATGQADRLQNRSGIIEAANAIAVNSKVIENTNDHFSTAILEYPEEGNHDRTEYIILNPSGNDLSTGYRVKLDRFERSYRGGDGDDVYDLVWNKNLTRKLTAEELVAGYIPEANIKVCSKADPTLCYYKVNSLYSDNDPIWAYFGIEPPEEAAPLLGQLPSIRKEPRRFFNSKYQEQFAAYRADIEAYNQAMQPYLDWIQRYSQPFSQLTDAIRQRNARVPSKLVERWSIKSKEKKVFKTTVMTSLPGQILAGGNILFEANQIINDKSTLIAGGDIQVQPSATALRNITEWGELRQEYHGIKHWYDYWSDGSLFGSKWRWRDSQEGPVVRIERTPLDLKVYKNFAHTVPEKINQAMVVTTDIKTSPLQPVVFASQVLPETQEIRSIQVDTRLPSSSLYRMNLNRDNHVLIETDPAYTNWRTWLSSEYMYAALRSDHNHILKRLGDGYYEQRLVREQINRLTGRQFVGNYQDFESQYKALMDAGISVAKQFHLTPGVSLSAEQVAQLTTDIVWLETESITLNNGQKIDVIVPRVYVVTRKDDIDGNGALLSANRLYLKADNIENNATMAGRELVMFSDGALKNLGEIGGDRVNMQLRELNNLGGRIAAQTGLWLNVEGDIRSSSTTDKTHINLPGYQRTETQLARKGLFYVKGEQGALQISANQLSLDGADIINEGKGITAITVNHDLHLGTVDVGFEEEMGEGDHYRNVAEHRAINSRIKGGGDVQLQAENIYAQGADIEANQTLIALAKNNLVLDSLNESSQYEEYHHYESSSLLSHSSSTTFNQRNQTRQIGSKLKGENISLFAQGNIEATGVSAIADKDFNLVAGNKIQIQSGTNTHQEMYFHEEKKSGLMSSGGIGFTIGSRAQQHDYQDKEITQSDARATIGSLGGDVTFVAGEQATILGTDVIAQADKAINITSKSMTVDAGKDLIERREQHEFKQSGLTVSLSTPATDMGMKARESLARSQQSTDSRLKALYAIKAAQEGAIAAQEAKKAVEAAQSGQNADFKVSVGIGSSQSASSSETLQVSHQGSTLNAGKVNLTTTESDLTLIGSTITAGNAKLDSAGNLSLLSAQDTMRQRSQNSNSGWSAGVFVGSNGGSYGFGVEGSAQVGKGYENSDSVTHVNSMIQADKVEARSGQDMSLKGGVVTGNKVAVEVGNNFIIESRQDSQQYESKQTQAGVSAAVAIYGSGSNASVNGSLTQGKLNYAQVATQSGLHAGEAGLTVNVAGNTHLKGGIVDSQASQEKNHFTTGSLTAENIKNYSEANVESMGGGLSTDPTQNIANGFVAGLSALGNINKQDSTTTHSAIGSNINLTTQQGDIPTALARDTKAANEQVEKTEIADLKTRQEMAQVIGEIANNGITIVLKPKLDEAERQKAEAEAILKNDANNQAAKQQLETANKTIKDYGQGSQIQLAVRAVTGVLQGMATGEASQAVVGGLSPYANYAIKKATTNQITGEVNTQANLMAHALLGAVEAYATGNNATAGAAGAVGGELAAKIITEKLYNKSPEDLTEAQKQTVTALSQLASGLAGGLISDSAAGAINAAEIGKRAVENNFSLNYTNEELEGMAINAKAVVLQKELDQQVTEELKKEYPLIYQTAEGTYYIVSKTGKAMYIAREVVIDAVPMFIVPEIGAGTKFYTLLSRMAVSGSANLAVQKLSGQEFNPYEFTGAVVSGIVSPSFKTTSEAIRFNAGIGMAIGMANGGDGIGDAALAAGATYGAAKVSNPIWSSVISESIQKLPIIFNSLKKEERNNEE